jgi:hypothetical protein
LSDLHCGVVVDRVYALLDSRFVSRVGNALTLTQILAAGGALVLALFALWLSLPGLWPLFALGVIAWLLLVAAAWRRRALARADPDARRRALTTLIRRGTEIAEEASMAGYEAEHPFRRSSDAAVAAELQSLRDRERTWTAEVEALLDDPSEFARFSEEHGTPANGHYAVHNRLEARVAVLRELRDQR